MRQRTALSWIIGVLAAAILIAWVFYAAKFASSFVNWTGFAADPLPPNTTATPVVIYQQEKTLWDWLQLLLVPVVLAVGGFLLTRSENRAAAQLQYRREQETLFLQRRQEEETRRLQEQREKEARDLQHQQAEEARKLEAERAQDAALQVYLDHMTELLLDKELRTSKEGDEVRSVARARTLTVLRVLDATRKGTVIQFLYEAALIGQNIDTIGNRQHIDAVLSLKGATIAEGMLFKTYLQGVNLQEANLEGVNLQEANLMGANLTRANLQIADLRWAILLEADLQQADLQQADLLRADLRGAKLTTAKMRWTKLQRADLRGAELQWVDLRWADLRGAYLQKTYLLNVKLQGADLRGANLKNVHLKEVNLQGADLEGAHLQGANLQGVNLQGAYLQRAYLQGANLLETNITREQLAQVAAYKGAKLPSNLLTK